LPEQPVKWRLSGGVTWVVLIVGLLGALALILAGLFEES
jgi:hypothetical protein